MTPYSAPGLEMDNETVKEIICKVFNIPPAAITSKSRKQQTVTARYVYIYYLYKKNYTRIDTGKMVCKDHATIVYAIKSIRYRYRHEKYLKQTIDIIGKLINFDFEKAI